MLMVVIAGQYQAASEAWLVAVRQSHAFWEIMMVSSSAVERRAPPQTITKLQFWKSGFAKHAGKDPVMPWGVSAPSEETAPALRGTRVSAAEQGER